MTRIILLELFLFLLPFILFGLWRFLVGSDRTGDMPVVLLIALGSLLFAAGLFHIASYETEGIEGRYVPPVYKDGKIVPGHFDHEEPKSSQQSSPK